MKFYNHFQAVSHTIEYLNGVQHIPSSNLIYLLCFSLQLHRGLHSEYLKIDDLTSSIALKKYEFNDGFRQ